MEVYKSKKQFSPVKMGSKACIALKNVLLLTYKNEIIIKENYIMNDTHGGYCNCFLLFYFSKKCVPIVGIVLQEKFNPA